MTRWQRFKDRAFKPINVPEMFRSTAMLMFAVTSIIAVTVVAQSKSDEHNRATALQAALDAKNGVDTCRAQVGSAVTDATTTYLFTVGHNVQAISDLVGVLALKANPAQALADLSAAATRENAAEMVLDAARDARVAFEARPSGGCTGEHATVSSPSPSSSTSTTGPPVPGTDGRSPTVSVRLSRTTTTTTTAPPSSPSTRRPPPPQTTTTTAAPLCRLIPPLDVPVTVPCL